jgi:rhomboid domain-containing protein 1
LQGAQLEPRLGTLPFLRLVCELALTSQLLYIGLAVLLRQQLAPAAGWALLRSCAVGFSGVLFGLKVVLNHNSAGWSEIYGVTIPTKFAAWGELVVAQLLIPNASFFGHLCGILAGLLYVLVTSRLTVLPWGAPGGCPRRGGSSRGLGNGNGGGGRQGGGRQGGLFRWLFGGSRRQRPRTYGHGTWGGGGGGGGSGRGSQLS